MNTVLISGASGFVGRILCRRLLDLNIRVIAAVRDEVDFPEIRNESFSPSIIGDIDRQTDWSEALKGVDTLFHLAARVHVMKETKADPLEEYRRVNVQGTEHLARSAAAAGVKRFVYVSSIKVNGEKSQPDRPFTEDDLPKPQDPYAISKWEAEQALHRVSLETGLEVVVVRPPLVYGAGVKGNFAVMIETIVKGIPLPFGSVHNRRSLIYVENLADALIHCGRHASAAGQTYLVSDGEDLSTPELLRRMGDALGRPARLLSFPPVLLKWLFALVGKREPGERLLGSLVVESGKIRREVSWRPPFSVQQGLHTTAEWYWNSHS